MINYLVTKVIYEGDGGDAAVPVCVPVRGCG